MEGEGRGAMGTQTGIYDYEVEREYALWLRSWYIIFIYTYAISDSHYISL
jgi:hypothetical protein